MTRPRPGQQAQAGFLRVSVLRDVDPRFTTLLECVRLRVVVLFLGISLGEYVPVTTTSLQVIELGASWRSRYGPVFQEYAGVVLAPYIRMHEGGADGDVLELHLAPASQKRPERA